MRVIIIINKFWQKLRCCVSHMSFLHYSYPGGRHSLTRTLTHPHPHSHTFHTLTHSHTLTFAHSYTHPYSHIHTSISASLWFGTPFLSMLIPPGSVSDILLLPYRCICISHPAAARNTSTYSLPSTYPWVCECFPECLLAMNGQPVWYMAL